MKEYNPFKKNTLKIIESGPDINIEAKDIKALSVEPDRNDYYAKPDLNKINTVLEGIIDKGDVELFQIHYDSNLRRLPNIKQFKNLKYVYIAGRKISKYDQLYKLDKTKRLFLVNYKEKSFTAFKEFSLDFLRAIRGRMMKFDVSCSSCFIQDCNKLVCFDDVEIHDLCIEGCQNIQLESFTKIEGLEKLELLGRKNIPSFDFIRGCRNLKHLVVTANSLYKTNITELKESRSLKKMFLGVKNQLTTAWLGLLTRWRVPATAHIKTLSVKLIQ